MSPNPPSSPRRGPGGGRPGAGRGEGRGPSGSGGRGLGSDGGRPDDGPQASRRSTSGGAAGARNARPGDGPRSDQRPGRPSRPGAPGRPAAGRGGGAGRPGDDRRGRPGDDRRDEGQRTAGPKNWGSLGRKGAGRLGDIERDRRNAGTEGRDERPDPGHEQVRWERVDDDVRNEANGAVRRSRGTGGAPNRGPAGGTRGPAAGNRGRSTRPPAGDDGLAPKERRGRQARKAGAGTGGADAREELVRALGAQRGARANDRLRDAAHAFERERFEESRSLLRPIAEAAPQATAVRELLGLTYYRLGRWNDAVRELEAFRQLADSTEQHPVLADCYRALKRRAQVEELWDELREASPSADLVTEGRIVMAGTLADQRKLAEAIALLEKSQRTVKRAEVHHLRQAYALADLYERAGEVARARELFRWVVDYEPGFADAAERAASLS